MHIHEGQLHAYQNNNLPTAENEQVKAHLAACPRCQKEAQELAQRAHQINHQLAALNPQPGEYAPSEYMARQRLQVKIDQQENLSMFNKLFSARLRPAWVALAIVLALAIALSFPQVRAAASSFLGLFRVQKIAIVPVDENAVSEKMSALDESFLGALFEGASEEVIGESLASATAEEASAVAGITVRLPENVTMETLSVEQGSRVSFQIDQPLMQSIFDETNLGIEIPKEADGATITGEIQPVVFASFNCEVLDEDILKNDPDAPANPTETKRCADLIQVASPTISAPPGLDISMIGEGYLQLMGMSAEDAKNFSQTVDWATTLVVPMPQGGSYENVTVDGVEGVLLRESTYVSDSHYILVWSKDGVVYALSDIGTNDAALSLGNSLK